MDTNFLGIPKEPIGTSNNATGFMGPPKFKNAKLKVTGKCSHSNKGKIKTFINLIKVFYVSLMHFDMNPF